MKGREMGHCGPIEQMDIRQKQAGKYNDWYTLYVEKNPKRNPSKNKETSMPREKIDLFNVAGFSLPSSPLFPLLCLLASTLWSFKETKY